MLPPYAPGSECSVIFGNNCTATASGSAQDCIWLSPTIEAAREELLGRGVEISEIFHDANGVHAGADEDPEDRGYHSYMPRHEHYRGKYGNALWVRLATPGSWGCWLPEKARWRTRGPIELETTLFGIGT
jgi:hypothetical protein